MRSPSGILKGFFLEEKWSSMTNISSMHFLTTSPGKNTHHYIYDLVLIFRTTPEISMD
jgi:hypothetical protein